MPIVLIVPIVHIVSIDTIGTILNVNLNAKKILSDRLKNVILILMVISFQT